MDYSVAEMSCVLNASVQCEACKAKVYEILQNIYGVYTIAMDAEEGTVKICGKVNPRTFLKVLENSGKHAEVKSIRFDGEVGEKRYYPYGDDPTSYELPYPHPLLDWPQQPHLFDRSYHPLQLAPPPLPPYPWQLMLPPPPPLTQPVLWPPQVPLPPPPAPWPMPMGPLPSPPDDSHKCCTIM